MSPSEWDDRAQPSTERAPRDASRVPERVRIVILSGPDRGRVLETGRGVFRIGKTDDCDLVLTDTQVSRAHLEIHIGDEVVVTDLGSSNGSTYRGARFTQVTVAPGAVIQIGATELQLKVADRASAQLPSTRERFGDLVGRSLSMRNLFAVLEQVSASDSAALIQGETGTGKELCAEAIHANGARSKGPFVVCDLASVSRTLIDSELFGHVRGAFTGADRDRRGAFEEAHGGTLFLDEIGELDPALQPRLLRAIESGTVRPVGASAAREVDVRIVAATNRNLLDEVRAGRFREDLYYRLSVVAITLPPLRERIEDVPLLAESCLASSGATLTPEAMGLLMAHEWPGNVRELRNVLERALSSARTGLIDPMQLGLFVEEPSQRVPDEDFQSLKDRLISTWEREYLKRVLDRADGNMSKASRAAGIDRPYLYRLLKKHGLGS